METRRLLIGCDFTYVAAIPTPVIFQVQPVRPAGPLLEPMLVQAEEEATG
ncbi:MAG: hypothetical protein JWM19_7286 [Actinomycetia bacterium]|nr:hypothetical protein [Actinomycetes bacterium]